MKKQQTLNKKELIGWWGGVPTGTAPTYYQPYAGVRTAYRIDIPPALMSIDVHSTGIYVTMGLWIENNYYASTSIYEYPQLTWVPYYPPTYLYATLKNTYERIK